MATVRRLRCDVALSRSNGQQCTTSVPRSFVRPTRTYVQSTEEPQHSGNAANEPTSPMNVSVANPVCDRPQIGDNPNIQPSLHGLVGWSVKVRQCAERGAVMSDAERCQNNKQSPAEPTVVAKCANVNTMCRNKVHGLKLSLIHI